MNKKITLKISMLVAIVGILLVIFGTIMLSILNQDVDFGSAGSGKDEPVITPTPTQTMDVEENNPTVSPTPTPVETENPDDIILPSGDANDSSDSEVQPTTPPDQGPSGSTSGEYVPPAQDDWVDETIPSAQYQLQITNEVSEGEFGYLMQTTSLGINFLFRDHTLYTIIRNGGNSPISYQTLQVTGSIGMDNVFMCTINQAGQFNAGEKRIYKCQISNQFDTNQIAVSLNYY